jgi:hypothetical protein
MTSPTVLLLNNASTRFHVILTIILLALTYL